MAAPLKLKTEDHVTRNPLTGCVSKTLPTKGGALQRWQEGGKGLLCSANSLGESVRPPLPAPLDLLAPVPKWLSSLCDSLDLLHRLFLCSPLGAPSLQLSGPERF